MDVLHPLGEPRAAAGVEDGVQPGPGTDGLLQGLVGGQVLAGVAGALLGQLLVEDDLPLLQYRQVGLGSVEQVSPVLPADCSTPGQRSPRVRWS